VVINRIVDFSARHRVVVICTVAAAAVLGAWLMRDVPLDAIPDVGDTQVIVYSRGTGAPISSKRR
jgi:Cu(I)/Ag(I) efflux system membrane protein CusA/SilA